MSDMFLVPSALVAVSDSHVKVLDGTSTVDISLDDPHEPAEILRHLTAGLASFARFVNGNSALVTEAFHAAGLVMACPPVSTEPPAGTMSLAAALAAIDVALSRRMLIYTATEAFWPGNDLRLARRAIRLFVSSLTDPGRCLVYGAIASGARLAVAGDTPDIEPLSRAVTIVQSGQIGYPCVVDLARGEITGSIQSELDIWSGGGKRLAVTQLGHTRSWQVDDSRTIHWVSGRTAFPNISCLPRVDDRRGADIDYPRVSGVDSDRTLAETKCRAEGIERFVAGDVRSSEIRRSAASSLAGRWLDPRTVISYAPPHQKRLGLTDFDPDKPEWWALGADIRGELWIPAAMVYYPFGDVPSWLHPSAVSSNGMAAFTDRDGARLRAWMELVERDAFQRIRLCGPTTPPDRIAPETLPPAEAQLFSLLASMAEVVLLRLPSPASVPVVLARADTPDGIALGMAAAPSVRTAAGKALTEALVQVTHPFTHRVDVTQVDTPGDHAALYSVPTWRSRLDWMLEGPYADVDGMEAPTIEVSPTACWYDFPGDYAGLVVSRVIDPSLIPLTFGYDTDPTGRADFAALMHAAGLDPSEPLDPHPFA